MKLGGSNTALGLALNYSLCPEAKTTSPKVALCCFCISWTVNPFIQKVFKITSLSINVIWSHGNSYIFYEVANSYEFVEWPTPNPAPKPARHWGLDKSRQICTNCLEMSSPHQTALIKTKRDHLFHFLLQCIFFQHSFFFKSVSVGTWHFHCYWTKDTVH